MSVGELLRGLPPLLAAHLELSLVALALAVAISLPLAIAIAPRPRIALPVITVAGIVQTIPGLALLALMVPVLASTHGFGVGLSAFGFSPAVIALTLYAILPILRNAITGLRGVDPSAVEAARGMGMTNGQILRQVELPLAAPVIAAGIRTASVWTVGAATLATPVGQACLGNYIFAGLQTRSWSMLLVGVVASAALAVALDLLLGAAEHALAGRRRKRIVWPVAGFAALVIAVVFVLPQLNRDAVQSRNSSGHSGRTKLQDRTASPIKLGAKTFTEQYILVEAIRQRLAAAGIESEVAGSLGSTVIFDALTNGDIDAYVDYSGTVYTNLMHRDAGAPRWQILVEVEAWLANDHHVRSLGSLGFENAYALAVRRDTADRLHLKTLEDLAKHPELALGADYEFFGRAEWASVRDAYGLRFARQATFDPTLLYDAMILLGPRVASDPAVACALAPLTGAIPVELMREANLEVDRDADKLSPADAARALLAQLRLSDPCRSGTGRTP